jgi:hypothetical protein
MGSWIKGMALLCLILDGTHAYAQGSVTSRSTNYVSYSGQTDPAVNTLYCGLDVNADLGLNHTAVIPGNDYQLKLSVDANFGGIGTGITFVNPANRTSTNIVQTASGAGAAWQTSYFVYDTAGDRLIVFDQGAGNDVASQWGYSNTVSNLTETGWNPLWSDHYHPTYSKTGFAKDVGTSPCNHTGFYFDDGRGSIVATPIETPYGNVTHITNAYQLKSNWNQSWGFVGVDQSLYLNGVVAVQSNLQIVLVGKSGWVEGPIRPTGKFTLHHAVGGCDRTGCSYETGSDVAYLLLNYTIGNKAYSIAVLEPKSRAVIIMTSTPYCTPDGDPKTCGAVQIHSFLTSNDPVTIAVGEIRNYQLEYYAGTPMQLAALGFDPIEGGTVRNYNPARATACTPNQVAFSNNQYPNNPVGNLVSNAGFYSTNPFANGINRNGTYATIAASAHGAGHAQLSARVVGGRTYGFPNLYRLYVSGSDGTSTLDLGLFNSQPDKTGMVDIPLGYKLDTTNLMIVPVSLGQDSYANYYLQLSKLSLCN